MAVVLLLGWVVAGPRSPVADVQTCPSCLGPPTGLVQFAGPLGLWRDSGKKLRAHRKPVLLFIGTKFEESAPERWPVTKALEQFGRFSGLAASTRAACAAPGTGIPTLDWLRATYRSRYVVFDHKDLYGYQGQRLQTLSRPERALYNRYVGGNRGGSGCTAIAQISGDLPLVAAGGYLLRGEEAGLDQNAFYVSLPNGSQRPLSFETVQRALQAKDPGRATVASQAAQYIDEETNVVTALLCHADGGRPVNVCRRRVIRQILRHVR